MSPLLERTHPEYPLLLPAFIARAWRIGGDITSPAAPLEVSFLFAACVMALLFTLLAVSRGLSTALLACFVFFAASSYVEEISWQYADIPMSFFFLAALGLALLSDGRRAPLLAAGAFSSFAAMTKNEGLAFALVSLLCYAGVTWKANGRRESVRRAAYWLGGAMPGLVLVAWFRLALAPYGIFRGQGLGEVTGKLLDPGRYAPVVREVFNEAFELGNGITHPLVLFGILALALRFDLSRNRAFLAFGALTLAVMLAVYCGVHIVAPPTLAWMQGTSPNRLYTSLWPSMVLLMFVALGQLRDPVESAEAHRAKRQPRPKRKK